MLVNFRHAMGEMSLNQAFVANAGPLVDHDEVYRQASEHALSSLQAKQGTYDDLSSRGRWWATWTCHTESVLWVLTRFQDRLREQGESAGNGRWEELQARFLADNDCTVTQMD